MKSSKRKPQDSKFLLAVIVVSQFALLHAGPSVPVVIWCSNNQSDIVSPAQLNAASSPLHTVATEDFERILVQSGKIIDLFICAEDLCIEDFKNNKVLLNATNGSKLYYFPGVDMPYSAFLKTFTYKQMKTIEDINDEHDLNMVLKDTDSSTCIALTGKTCRYSYNERIKRDVLADNKTDFKIRAGRVLLYSGSPLIFKTKQSDKEILLHSSGATASTRKDAKNNTLILTINFSGVDQIGRLKVDFFFEVISMGYYSLKKIETDASDPLETKRDIHFPFNFSYHCSPNTTFINDGVYLNIQDMQVQLDSEDGTFSDAYDCVGFTSIPIWTGIFVTTILILIMTWALIMIMDIRTMDRFDDPKGKTITISAAD